MAEEEPKSESTPPAAAAASPDTSPPPEEHGKVTFEPATHPRFQLTESHVLFPEPHPSNRSELMGPILRRKKVVSMPLGAGGDFFVTTEPVGGAHRQLFHHDVGPQRVKQKSHGYYAPSEPTIAEADIFSSSRTRQPSIERLVRRKQRSIEHREDDFFQAPSPPSTPRARVKQNSAGVMRGIVRRKQVSLDLLGPNDFFAVPTEGDEEVAVLAPAAEEEEEEEVIVVEEGKGEVKLFRPLRFAPRVMVKKGGGGHGGGHGGGGHGRPPPSEPASAAPQLSTVDEETVKAFTEYSNRSEEVKAQLMSLREEIEKEEDSSKRDLLLRHSEHLLNTYSGIKPHEDILRAKLMPDTTETARESLEEDGGDEAPKAPMEEEFMLVDDGIIRATKTDLIKTAICFSIMLALTVVFCVWSTHLNEESYIHERVGLACVTDCLGNPETKDFFHGHNHFKSGQVIDLIMHLDPNELHDGAEAEVFIIGEETGEVKATRFFGPALPEERLSPLEERVTVHFDHPDEPHYIQVNSTVPEIQLSFTLDAHVLQPLADNSVLIAGIIMVAVYFFILIEVIHRTLVAIIGSMIALLFYFAMQGGQTQSIQQLMLHLEWSTLGLLFGMMLIVGELSTTGVFEWCAVRLLMASKGSFNRLMVLLCTLTAIASAFLDNVTTMLLVAPVTIDMCNILDVDPRPYLLGEVLLSNIGGTATLIGDPPNIIIGSSFSQIGFVDFITNILPCIFLFCIPVSLLLILWIFRYYLTANKMAVLDTDTLKKTYPIYDQPRLMIAGTVTLFVILLFFLHPIHHKDTAWIALVGAFVTISFTNPHDIQDALRNYVEWDTLLFFAGLFVLVEVCAAMGLLSAIGDALASIIQDQPEEKQLAIAITLIMWVSAITSAFLDNIPYTATMIPVIQILHESLPDTLPLDTLAWALSFGACLGGNGTLLGASANIVTAGISTNKGFDISFLNFLYPGMLTMVVTVAISNLYMLVRYVWI